MVIFNILFMAAIAIVLFTSILFVIMSSEKGKMIKKIVLLVISTAALYFLSRNFGDLTGIELITTASKIGMAIIISSIIFVAAEAMRGSLLIREKIVKKKERGAQ